MPWRDPNMNENLGPDFPTQARSGYIFPISDKGRGICCPDDSMDGYSYTVSLYHTIWGIIALVMQLPQSKNKIEAT